MSSKRRTGKAPRAGAALPPVMVATSQSKAGWRSGFIARLKTVKGAVVAVAGVGTVLGGLAGFWNVYQAARQVEPSLLALVGTGDAGPLSFVVLPFLNLTEATEQAYLADGITVALTTDLSRIPDAFIVSARTAFVFRNKTVALPQIARELGVRYVVQGEVQREGQKIRVTAHLSEASTSKQLWAESFEGTQAELFELQERLTTRIGNSVGREAVIAAARLSTAGHRIPKAIDLVLRASAVSLLKPFTLSTLNEAATLYRGALALDPEYTEARVGLAVTLANGSVNGLVTDSDERERQLVESRELALKAKEQTPNDPRIYSVLSMYAGARGDFDAAKRADETALALDPRNPLRYSNLSDDYFQAGVPSKAIELLSQGIKIDPRQVHFVILSNMGRTQFMAGEDDAAIQWSLRAIDVNPTFALQHAYLAASYARKGDLGRAKTYANEVMRLDPKFRLVNFEALASTQSEAYRKFREAQLLPACRLAGLPS